MERMIGTAPALWKVPSKRNGRSGGKSSNGAPEPSGNRRSIMSKRTTLTTVLGLVLVFAFAETASAQFGLSFGPAGLENALGALADDVKALLRREPPRAVHGRG